ncbi:hypothetical protein ACEE42_07965 [Streptococcus suis]
METSRNHRKKTYYFILGPKANFDSKVHRIDLQSEAINDFEAEKKALFESIQSHFPDIRLEDERLVSRRKSDRLMAPWRNSYWIALMATVVFAAIAVSPFFRAELVADDKITIGVFGFLALLTAFLGILRVVHNLRLVKQLTSTYPELLGQDLVEKSDWSIPDLRLYRYKQFLFC